MGNTLIAVMTTAEDVRAAAFAYLPYAAITALSGVLAFQMDGVYLGATWSRDIRNMMLVSLAVFVVLIGLLVPGFGNTGLWIAFNLFLLTRGLALATMLPRRARLTFARAKG